MDRKAPKSEGNPNADFCEALIELANWEKNVNRNQHKSNAYRKAAQVLSNLDYRISSGSEAKALQGIGEKIAKKIDEIIETGKLKKLDTIRNDDETVAVNDLTRVAGIGPAKAKELFQSGIDSIDKLKDKADILSKAQKVGLKYVEDFEKRIPRTEIKQFESKIRKILKKVDRKYVMTICGSYRREKETSGDIDILLTHPDFTVNDDKSEATRCGRLLHVVVEELSSSDIITDTLSRGETKVNLDSHVTTCLTKYFLSVHGSLSIVRGFCSPET